MAVTINGTTGITTTGDYDAEDGDKILLGTGDDLQIFHDGNNNHIQGTTAGQSIYLKNDYEIQFLTSTNEKQLVSKANGAVELYYDNAKVFETLDYGAKIKRPSGGATSLDIVGCEGQDAVLFLAADDGDDNNDQMRLVAGQGSYSLQNYGGGSWETNASFHADAQVELYYNSVKTFSTISEGVRVQADEGASAVLELWADQGDDNSDKWRLVSDQSSNYFYLQNYAAGSWESTIRALGNGAVELYYDNNKKLETNSDGITIPGHNAIFCENGNWTGETGGKIQYHSNSWYQQYTTSWIARNASGNNTFTIDSSGNFSSDVRRKKDISTVADALSTIKKLRGVEFTWIDTDKKDMGLIAQEVESHLPRLISNSPEPEGVNLPEGGAYKMMNYNGLFSVAVEAIKELSAEVDTLKTEKTKLQTDLTALTARVAALEAA